MEHESISVLSTIVYCISKPCSSYHTDHELDVRISDSMLHVHHELLYTEPQPEIIQYYVLDPL